MNRDYYPKIVPCTWCGQLHYSDDSIKFDGTVFCCEQHKQAYKDATDHKEELDVDDP